MVQQVYKKKNQILISIYIYIRIYLNSIKPSIQSYKLSLMPRPDNFFGVPKDAENTPDPTTYAYVAIIIFIFDL